MLKMSFSFMISVISLFNFQSLRFFIAFSKQHGMLASKYPEQAPGYSLDTIMPQLDAHGRGRSYAYGRQAIRQLFAIHDYFLFFKSQVGPDGHIENGYLIIYLLHEQNTLKHRAQGLGCA